MSELSTEQPAEPPRARWRSAGLAWALIALAFIAPFPAVAILNAPAYGSGLIVGRILMWALAVLLIIVMIWRAARPAQRLTVLLAGAVLLWLISGWTIYRLAEFHSLSAEFDAASAEMARSRSAAAAPAVSIDLADKRIPLRERLVAVAQRARGRELDMAREFREKMAASNIEQSLDMARLADSQGRREISQSAARYREALAWHKKMLLDLQAASAQDIRALALPESSVKEMLAGNAKAVRENQPKLEAFYDRERRFVTLVEELVSFLDAHAGSFKLEGDTLIFQSPADSASFETRMHALTQPEAPNADP